MAVTDPKFNPSNNEHIDYIKRRVVELEEYARADKMRSVILAGLISGPADHVRAACEYFTGEP